MNLSDIYNYFLSQGLSPQEAAQAAAWQAITNPSGSITQLKVPQKWYSDDEIYNFYAPDFSAALNFPVVRDPQGALDVNVDPLAAYTSESLKNVLNTKGKITFGDLSNIASNASKQLRTPNYGSKLFSDYNISTQDYYNQLKDIAVQYQTAQREIDKQKETHPFAQRGLPDPTLRYGLVNNPAQKLIAYQPAVDYLNKKSAEQEQKFRKAGLTGTQLNDSLKKYRVEISKAVQKKIDESGITPFVEEAKNLVSVKKGK